MKIRSIRIQNFRSIKDITIRMGNLLALIGPNNAGKSNIMKAIKLVLEDGKPSEEDFYYEPKNEMEIMVEFELNSEKKSLDGNTLKLKKQFSYESSRLSTKSYIYENSTFKELNKNEIDKIKQYIPEVIYIPAIRYLYEEAKVNKTNPFGKLIKLILDPDVENELGQFSKKVEGNVSSISGDIKFRTKRVGNRFRKDFDSTRLI